MIEYLHKREHIKVFLISLLFGIIVHSEMIFQKLSRHDDLKMMGGLSIEGAIGHGRWTYAVLSEMIGHFFGMESIAGIFGVLGVVMISLLAIIVCKHFNIDELWQMCVIAFIMLVIPSVASNFGYLFTSLINFTGITIGIIATYVVTQKRDARHFLIGASLFAVSLGEYQCYFALYVTGILLYELLMISQYEKAYPWKEFLIDAVYYVFSAVCGVVLYVVITEIAVKITDTPLYEYAGTSSYGIVGLSEYLSV